MSKSRQFEIIAEASKKIKKETVMGKLANSNDPMEPWSKKHEVPLDEAGELAKYIRSLGYDPKHMDFASRAKYARSNAFKKFKVRHYDDRDPKTATEIKLGEETLDEAGTGLLMSYIKSKGLDPTLMDGNKKSAYSKSSEFRVFKQKRLKEISGMGERGEDMNEEKPCWDGYQMVGTKKKKGKEVPNCVPEETLDEISMNKLDQYTTAANKDYDKAYSSGDYKRSFKRSLGLVKAGSKKIQKDMQKLSQKNEEVVQEGIYGREDSPLSATNSVKAMESTNKRNRSKSARIIKAIYKKKGVKKESMYDWEKDDKGGKQEPTAKKVLTGGKTMTGSDRDTVEIEPILKTRPGQKM